MKMNPGAGRLGDLSGTVNRSVVRPTGGSMMAHPTAIQAAAVAMLSLPRAIAPTIVTLSKTATGNVKPPARRTRVEPEVGGGLNAATFRPLPVLTATDVT